MNGTAAVVFFAHGYGEGGGGGRVEVGRLVVLLDLQCTVGNIVVFGENVVIVVLLMSSSCLRFLCFRCLDVFTCPRKHRSS